MTLHGISPLLFWTLVAPAAPAADVSPERAAWNPHILEHVEKLLRGARETLTLYPNPPDTLHRAMGSIEAALRDVQGTRRSLTEGGGTK